MVLLVQYLIIPLIVIKTLINENAYLKITNLPQGPQNPQNKYKKQTLQSNYKKNNGKTTL